MSAVALIMNLFLSTLLLAALAFGWRLERRLKTLKDSHDSFARAVADLDTAAARAEQGLADLRAATDEAAETLSDRIETARALSVRLERGVSASSTPMAQTDARPNEIVRERAEFVRAEPAVTPRSRARVDDDLFEPATDAGRLRAISGGRR
ncbi:MAG: flagellar positioning protein PflI [Caulobacterales bacterium]|nr:flagellar positioning protein PflI [Caulobacterales bacterium]